MTFTPPPSPRVALRAVIALAALTIAAGVWGIIVATAERGAMQGYLFTLAFEALILGAGVAGVFVGLGRCRESHPLALLCIGGTMIVAAGLALVASGRAAAVGGIIGQMMFALTDPLTATRWLLAMGMLGAGAFILMSRRPRESLRLALMGIAFGTPLVVIAAAMLLAPVRGRIISLPPVALAMLVFVAFLVGCVSLSGSVHCLIRALEIGRADLQNKRAGSA